jgi:hypothetical protein
MIFGTLLLFDIVFLVLLFLDWLVGITSRWIR